MSNSIKPFSSTHEFDFGSIHQKKMKNTVMSQRSASNNSSVYENVLHSPKMGKAKPMTRLEYLIGRKLGNRSPSQYEVVADVLEHGISVNMSREQESSMVERLVKRQKSRDGSSFEEETYSYRPQISDYSRSVGRKEKSVFQSLAMDAHMR